MNWTPLVAVVSLLISVSALYFTQLRGAQMKVKLIQRPTHWTFGLEEKWPAGVQRVTSIERATHCLLSGSTFALVANDGPKGGAVWNLRLTLTSLPDALLLQQPFLDAEPNTLGGSASASLPVTFCLEWAVKDTETVLTLLGRGSGAVDAYLTYQRHRFWWSTNSTTNHQTVPLAEIWGALRQSASSQVRSLAAVAARARIDAALSQAMIPLELSEGDQVAFLSALWLAIHQPDSPLDYHIAGFDGEAQLQFRPGLSSNVINADRRIETLSHIAEIHEHEIEHAQRAIGEMRTQLGCE